MLPLFPTKAREFGEVAHLGPGSWNSAGQDSVDIYTVIVLLEVKGQTSAEHGFYSMGKKWTFLLPYHNILEREGKVKRETDRDKDDRQTHRLER